MWLLMFFVMLFLILFAVRMGSQKLHLALRQVFLGLFDVNIKDKGKKKFVSYRPKSHIKNVNPEENYVDRPNSKKKNRFHW